MANLSNINNKFLVTTGGDVGVGITSPVEKLDTLNIAIGGATITSYSPNKLRIDNNGGNSRFYSTGANTTTTGSYQIHVTSSDGSINNPALTIASNTNATFAGAISASNTITLDSAGSAVYIADRANNTSNATYEYKTGGSSKWYTGLRGISTEDFYIFNVAQGSTSLLLNSSNNSATFAGTITSGTLSVGTSGTSRFTDTNAYPLQLNRGLAVDVVGAAGTIFGLGAYSTGTTYIDAVRIVGVLDANGTDGDMLLQVLNSGTHTTALTLNNDTNATFAGNVTGTNAFFDSVTTGTYYKSSSASNVIGTGSSGEVLLRPTAWNLSTAQSSFTTTLATIGTNATFAGNITLNPGNSNKIILTPDVTSHYITANGYWIDIVGNAAEVLRVFGGVGGTSEYFRVAGNGNVGIGTTSPNKELTLGGAAGTQTLSFTTSAYLGDQAVIGNIEFSTHNADASYGQLANIYALKTGTNTNSGDITFWTKQNGGRAERIRIENDGTLRVKTGSIIIDSTSQGIFLGGTATANKLDDYEEGTWTPVASDFTGNQATVNTTNSTGVYTKIGDLVYWRFTIQMTSKASMISGETFKVSGFPFTSSSIPGNWYRPSSVIIKQVTFSGFVNFSLVASQSYGYFFDSQSAGAGGTIPVSDIADNCALSVTGVYKAN